MLSAEPLRGRYQEAVLSLAGSDCTSKYLRPFYGTVLLLVYVAF
jgi:hypothetical protein